jgi:hypothetical protein
MDDGFPIYWKMAHQNNGFDDDDVYLINSWFPTLALSCRK